MDTITICDLEVFYSVGITEQERSRPQRLLLTLAITTDFSSAAKSDRIEDTIDYKTLSDRLLALGDGRSWNLLEKLADTIALIVIKDFGAQQVSVEVKKFIIPQARYVSVSVTRSCPSSGPLKPAF